MPPEDADARVSGLKHAESFREAHEKRARKQLVCTVCGVAVSLRSLTHGFPCRFISAQRFQARLHVDPAHNHKHILGCDQGSVRVYLQGPLLGQDQQDRSRCQLSSKQASQQPFVLRIQINPVSLHGNSLQARLLLKLLGHGLLPAQWEAQQFGATLCALIEGPVNFRAEAQTTRSPRPLTHPSQSGCAPSCLPLSLSQLYAD